MDPRTGKTKVCIDYASILHQGGKVNRVVVIAPVGVLGVWVDEIHAHCPFRHRIVVWDRDGRKETTLPRLGQSYLDFVLVNYDAFSTPGRKQKRGKHRGRRTRKGGRFETTDSVIRWQPQMVILDESHRIKSWTAKKTKMIVKLGRVADYRVLATGTSVTKKKRIFDLYAQWQFLNPSNPMVSGKTLGEFKNEFGVWINRNGFPQWIRNKNLKTLRKHLHNDSFAITRDECFDLPPRTDQIIPVELVESAPAYTEMAEEMIAQLKSGEMVEASIKLVQGLRLAQITSGVAKTTPTPEHPKAKLVRVGKEKLEVLESLLSDLFEADEKVVIAARFIADIHAIEALCKKLKTPVFPIYGAIPRNERHRNVKKFKEHDGAAAFVVQPAAGSEGIDLRAASIFIWYSLTSSWVQFRQVEDRVALSERKTTFMYLLATGTVDELMYEALTEDGNVAKMVTESPDRLLRNFKKS